MTDDLDESLNVDVAAALLRMDRKEAGDLLEFLAQKLKLILPDAVEIKQGGWFLSKVRPVEQITVRMENFHFVIARERIGTFSTQVTKMVRGVGLKTEDVPIDQWMKLLATELTEVAKQSATARSALQKFVIG